MKKATIEVIQSEQGAGIEVCALIAEVVRTEYPELTDANILAVWQKTWAESGTHAELHCANDMWARVSGIDFVLAVNKAWWTSNDKYDNERLVGIAGALVAGRQRLDKHGGQEDTDRNLQWCKAPPDVKIYKDHLRHHGLRTPEAAALKRAVVEGQAVFDFADDPDISPRPAAAGDEIPARLRIAGSG